MSKENFNLLINSKKKIFDLNLREIWEYKDLIFIFVKRDIVSIYKQTILGPVWFLIGPLFTVFTYTFLFKEVAHLSTDGLPGPIFYLSGTTLWNYFLACFNGTSSTFSNNAGIFGKVYFPRLVTPISVVISNLLKLFIQLLTFSIFLIYYMNQKNSNVRINEVVVIFPLIIMILGGIAFGFGILISSLTSKYRDLTLIVGVFMSILMYATPIMYPSSSIPELYKPYLDLNPLSPLIEGFRYGFTSSGDFSIHSLLYSFIFMIIILFLGILVFNRTEKTFMDTI